MIFVYYVLSSNDQQTLVDMVNNAMAREHCVPKGGISVVVVNGELMFYQAMTRISDGVNF